LKETTAAAAEETGRGEGEISSGQRFRTQSGAAKSKGQRRTTHNHSSNQFTRRKNGGKGANPGAGKPHSVKKREKKADRLA